MSSGICDPPSAPGEDGGPPRRAVLAQVGVLTLLLLGGCVEGAGGVPPVQLPSPPQEPTGRVTLALTAATRERIRTTAQDPTQADEEYAVYGAAIAALYAPDDRQFIVLRDRTAPHVPSGGSLDSEMAYLRRELGSAVEAETLESYRTRNGEAADLHTAFSADKAFTLLSDRQMDKIFERRDGWARFYELYPGSQGILTLSRAGFNGQMDQALVYVSNQADSLAGRGYYMLLSREGQAWRLDELVTAWIS